MAKQGKKLGWKSIFKDSKYRNGVDNVSQTKTKIKPLRTTPWYKRKKGDR